MTEHEKEKLFERLDRIEAKIDAALLLIAQGKGGDRAKTSEPLRAMGDEAVTMEMAPWRKDDFIAPRGSPLNPWYCR